jgi:WD40 repeat protein
MKIFLLSIIIIFNLNNINSLSEELKWQANGNLGAVISLNFSTDGEKFITTSFDNIIKIWDIKKGKILKQLMMPYVIKNINFLNDNNTIVASHFYKISGNMHQEINDYSIKFIDLENGVILSELIGHNGIVNSTLVSPDGKFLLSCSSDSTIKLWDLNSSSLIYSIDEVTKIEQIALSPDGKYFIYIVKNNLIEIRNTSSGELLDTIDPGIYNNNLIKEIKISPDGKYIIAKTTFKKNSHYKDDLYVFDFDNRNLVGILQDNQSGGVEFSISYDSKYLAYNGNIWDFQSMTLCYSDFYSFDDWYSSSSCIRFLPNSHQFIVSTGCGIGIWDAETGNQINTISEFFERVRALTFTNDSKSVITSSQSRMKYFDSETGIKIKNLYQSYDAEHIEFTNDGKYLVITSSFMIVFLDPITGEMIKRFLGDYFWESDDVLFSYSIHGKLSPDNKLLAGGSEYRNIRIWDVESKQLIDSIYTGFSVSSLDFSNDSKLLASGNWGSLIFIYDIANKSIIQSINSGYKYLNQVKFLKDKNWIAGIGNDSSLKVWDFSTGELIYNLISHSSEIKAMNYISELNIIVTASLDGTIKFWDITTGRIVNTFNRLNSEFISLAVSPNNKYISASTNDASVFLWEIDLNSLGATDNKNFPENIKIYPNPTEGEFHIYINSAEILEGENLPLKITDITGRTVYEESISADSNPIIRSIKPNLQSGVYFIHVMIDGRNYSARLVVNW